MKIPRIIETALLAICVLATCGDSCLPEQTGSPGFPVDTDYVAVAPDGTILGGGGVPGQSISGTWLSDNAGAVGTIYQFATFTDDNGTYLVRNGRINANWSAQVIWNPPCGQQTSGSQIFPDVDALGFGFTCILEIGPEAPNTSTHFVLPGSIPSEITSYGDFSTTYGDPQLQVYIGGGNPSLITTVSASTAVSGVSATFPFPTYSNGTPLGQGFYGLTNTNITSGGGAVFVNPSYLAVGGTTALSSAFGIDAVDVQFTEYECNPHGCFQLLSDTEALPIVTQYYGNSIASYTGATIPVGSEPVAVKAYGGTTSISSGSGSFHYVVVGPAHAIVANSGSSSVSIVDFANNTDAVNITVGPRPMALTINSAGTYAYVASYGNGSLAEIDLSTNTVKRTATGLAGALSVAMDPSGSYVWVGGTNNLYEVSLSTFAVVKNVAVTGSVTSLAVSNAQKELVYTLVENCCTSSSSYTANELVLSNLSTPGSYAKASASPYAAYTMNGTLPSAAALPQATTVVSARFSNGMGASATPTGFIIYDLINHKTIMTGATPTPVRSIASDPDCMFAYFTLPDSNEYISVPLESSP